MNWPDKLNSRRQFKHSNKIFGAILSIWDKNLVYEKYKSLEVANTYILIDILKVQIYQSMSGVTFITTICRGYMGGNL